MALLSCSHCKQEKEQSLFPKATGKPRGYAWICKECKNEKRRLSKEKADPQEWHLKERAYTLKSEYGITLDDYNHQLRIQDHKCAVCGCDETEALKGLLFVDHCHQTGRLRGLLCHHCNTALGKFRDSPEILNNAINYVRNSQWHNKSKLTQ